MSMKTKLGRAAGDGGVPCSAQSGGSACRPRGTSSSTQSNENACLMVGVSLALMVLGPGNGPFVADRPHPRPLSAGGGERGVPNWPPGASPASGRGESRTGPVRKQT